MYLIFDTETTGIPHNKTAPISDLDNWPRVVQLAWQLHDSKGKLVSRQNFIIKPNGFDIPYKAEQVHGISTKRALEEGHDFNKVLEIFTQDLTKTSLLVGHNIEFDISILGAEFLRHQLTIDDFLKLEKIDTGIASIEFCQLTGGIGGRLKMPRLVELHEKLFGKDFGDAHDASYDVAATARCFFGLITQKVVKPFDVTPPEEIVYEEPNLEAANFTKREKRKEAGYSLTEENVPLSDKPFVHLHAHSQFSVLQATPDIKAMVAKAKELGMSAIAITDLGNMYGAFKFVREAINHELKPIVGCEFFVADERKKLKFTKDNPDKRYQQVLLAKNKNGYHNLAKLSSLGFTEGLYGIYPRIDKELIQQYKQDLIATTGNLHSEVPHLILHVGEKQAEEAFKWWHQTFGDDFYIELNRHGVAEEDHVNETLLRFAAKYNVKYFAANECFYLDKEEARAHDVLLCIKEGEFMSTPIGYGRGHRLGLANDQYYYKSQDEMRSIFRDLPEAIETISEILGKIESYTLERNVLLPKFDIPAEFNTEDEYLRYLTYEGAKKKYPEITQAIADRLDFELATIQKTGYPGYFLIVQDFTSKAREMGVSVGPGRGSAAGSAVAYCIGITNVDPIKYDLLFERFLNPDRVSLPDIDIDFDDEGRDKVLRYVIDKYGKSQVAQIITYGTMAAKSSIRDCARVMELPLTEANLLAKMIPEKPGTTLDAAFQEVKELADIKKGSDLKAEVIQQAVVLEGSVRNTGVHACGVIITPDDLTKFVPVSTAKDSDMLVTQFDNSVVESAGMLKMDFLGLTTLSIIRTALKNIKKSRGIDINIDEVPLNDATTYQLFQRGETTGTFQFESVGMQKYLRQLKPDKFEDLIAMNALYRPGPMEYIPAFVNRKHGREPIKYDLPEMAEFLSETYGITVYQEQVMLLSQKLAGFSKGDADVLRKAMGKKQKAVLDKMKDKFIQGCQKNGHDQAICEKIWTDWEAFAQYAFNKSHSTCYSLVAYHTAYLKANYPAEYMAAVLTHSQSNLENVTFFIEECRNLGIRVLGPHINESGVYFEVNKNGEIRFGLGAIKGAGDAAVEAIIQEREQKGHYADIFDFAKRLSQRAVNKKTFECLALSGALDCFKDIHRRQYVYAREGDISLIEKAIRFAAKTQQEEQSAQASLFGGASGAAMPKPRIENVEPFSEIEKLNLEKEVVGIYISGHPLDNFKFEMETFCTAACNQLNELEPLLGRELKLGGIVSAVEHRTTKTGKPFGKFSIEDYSGNASFVLFGEDYLRFKNFMTMGWFLFIEGMVVKNNWGQMNLEFKIRNIDLLDEIGLKRTKGITLNLNTEDITKDFIGKIEDLGKQHSGKVSLYLKLRSSEENIVTEPILVRKIQVSPATEFIKKIEKVLGVDYEVMR
ncbi:DNA polymerase III subunit alpha [Fulvivirgaceae bacterium PWU4]|uniref:DNA polymerase III subunit alpha n=1 Tax=Chryseosolibacter histidini TaxID=2782349 RepID=A0AAP2DKQ2_9BACT|nr:DNA polymerase III subunit alpha [Chryseosolibacter histidini]MBT1697946.1 DNA polymerase III subunit alpha [Chryseosolibacter histidini]